MSKYTYIICGKLYNGIDAEFKEGYKILVKDNKIELLAEKFHSRRQQKWWIFRMQPLRRE